VVLSKFDEWSHLLGPAERREPWRKSDSVTGIDLEQIERQSENLRRILTHYCPETVAAAESFASDVTYIAVSALGDRLRIDPVSGLPGIRPRDIDPYWVTVPLLYSISRVLPGLIPRVKRRSSSTIRR